MKKYWVLVFLITQMDLYCIGQTSYMLIDQTDTVFFENQSGSYQREVNKVLLSRISEGYIFASLDSISQGVYHITSGTYRRVDIDMLQYEGDTTRFPARGNIFSKAQRELKNLSNSGYPFAQVKIGQLRKDGERLKADLNVNIGPYVQFDSLYLLSPIEMKNESIARLLGVDIGDPYSEDLYNSIPSRVRQWPFISLENPIDIGFSNGLATIYLDLKYQPSSKFDGVVGVLPNQADGTTLLTGFVDLDLQNLFETGQSVLLDWSRFNVQSQTLSLAYGHPDVFKTNLELETEFSFLRQDSSFVNRHFDVGLGYRALQGSRLSFLYNFDGSSGLNESYSNFKTNWYGIEIVRKEGSLTKSNFFNYQFSFLFGQRELNNVDSVTSSSNSLKVSAFLEQQNTLGKQGALFGRLKSDFIHNDNLLKNELYRVGGLRSLRGYNEKEFFAKFYAIATVEYRLFFENRSFLSVFFDQSYLDTSTDQFWPSSFGGGMNLDVNSGLFTIMFAQGFQFDQSFDSSNVKIHFGYSILF